MMYDRMKKFLYTCVDLVLVLIMLVALSCYFMINSIIATNVINDLRLDTYVTYETGLGIVLLFFLLVWGPVWLFHSIKKRG